MDRLGKNMYDLVFMNEFAELKTRLFPSLNSFSTIGGIKLAGTIRSSHGVGRPEKRDLGSYALVYLLAGSGEYQDSAGLCQRVRGGDLIWLFPGLAHSYGPEANERWEEIYLVFDGPFADLWREQKILNPDRPIWRLEPMDFWYGRLKTVALASVSTGWEDEFHQLTQFQGLVADMLLASRDATENVADRQWLTPACGYLQTAGPSSPSLEEVARMVGLSYESFRKKFARQMGVAPAKYRQARVIERACGLLMQRSLSHKKIAEQLGFCDEFHFSKTFRQFKGFSPHVFRLKALGSTSK